jgi:hypothetical protein
MSESMMNEIHDRESINIIAVAIGRSWLCDKLIKRRDERVKGQASNENNSSPP